MFTDRRPRSTPFSGITLLIDPESPLHEEKFLIVETPDGSAYYHKVVKDKGHYEDPRTRSEMRRKNFPAKLYEEYRACKTVSELTLFSKKHEKVFTFDIRPNRSNTVYENSPSP